MPKGINILKGLEYVLKLLNRSKTALFRSVELISCLPTGRFSTIALLSLQKMHSTEQKISCFCLDQKSQNILLEIQNPNDPLSPAYLLSFKLPYSTQNTVLVESGINETFGTRWINIKAMDGY